MTDRELIRSLVRRHLRRASGFVVAAEGSPLPVGAEPDEVRLGDYRNPAPWEAHTLVFTDVALYAEGRPPTYRLRWADVVDYELPPSKEGSVGVRILTPSGFAFARMAGTAGPTGNVKDVFGLIMILKTLAERRRREVRAEGDDVEPRP
ncbi:MAG: hypothetical protein H6719_14505 [Sandaracinaceae bacterium]|nr:hypothetical protein [Sandaracinaceae bacterium]